MCGPSVRWPMPTINIILPAFGWYNSTMSMVNGNYSDNYFLTHHAINMLEKAITCKIQSLYEHVWGKGNLFHLIHPKMCAIKPLKLTSFLKRGFKIWEIASYFFSIVEYDKGMIELGSRCSLPTGSEALNQKSKIVKSSATLMPTYHLIFVIMGRVESQLFPQKL